VRRDVVDRKLILGSISPHGEERGTRVSNHEATWTQLATSFETPALRVPQDEELRFSLARTLLARRHAPPLPPRRLRLLNTRPPAKPPIVQYLPIIFTPF
jgi:hypothetical protein